MRILEPQNRLAVYQIPDIPPSNNKFIGRRNIWEYQKTKKEWLALLSLFCKPRPLKPYDGVEVSITYHFKDSRRRDPDNYSGKMILDGLKELGIIKDDCFNCIDLTVRQGKADKANPRTIIKITKRGAE